jgi:hypothetical protein
MNFVVSVEGVKEFDTRWIGWAGLNVPDEVGQKALTKALSDMVFNIVYFLVDVCENLVIQKHEDSYHL